MLSFFAIILPMNNKHLKTLTAVFTDPVSSTILWADIEALLIATGAVCKEGTGSRVRFRHGNVVASFHRPHPAKEASPYRVLDARKFLESIGVKP
jgi:hypothetical protein